jgi:hypothetical protein
MNIFFTHDDPRICARNLDDKRVIKMTLESAQMLCTALHQHGAGHLAQYKPTHPNHPSNIWCRETSMNYGWLLMHFAALAQEYTFRTGKVHKSYRELFPDLLNGIQFIPNGNLTPYANCAARKDLDISYKDMDDTCEAYKLYLIDRWALDKRPPLWTNRSRPF